MKIIRLMAVCCIALTTVACNKEKKEDPTLYQVTVVKSGEGTVSLSSDNATVNSKITLTATPNAGYLFTGWTVSSGGNIVGEYTPETTEFSMPAKDVVVSVEFALVREQMNSYMVEPSGASFLIPVSQANRVLSLGNPDVVTTGLTEVTGDNYTVELVWADLPVGPEGVLKSIGAFKSGNAGYVKVTPGKAGNAVVGIKVGGEFRWSWHVWVTDEVGSDTDPGSGLTWMDRNLGAAGTTYDESGKNGLFYQWGRKDALPGSNGKEENGGFQPYYIGDASVPTTDLPFFQPENFVELVRNPLKYVPRENDKYEYLGSIFAEHPNDSWGGFSGTKTIFDPCPAGWKVPSGKATVGPNQSVRNAWGVTMDHVDHPTSWSEPTGKGRYFKGITGEMTPQFYPFTGALGSSVDVNLGVITAGGMGDGLSVWTSISSGGTYSDYLNCQKTIVRLAVYFRGPGRVVRCVKE